MKNILSLLFVFQLVSVFGQDRAYDSLKFILDHAKHDTTVYNAYRGLGRYYRSLNPDSAIYFNEKALETAEKIGDHVKAASSWGDLGWMCYVRGDYDGALERYDSARVLLNIEIENKKGMALREPYRVKAVIQSHTGVIYASRAVYDTAMLFFSESIEIDRKIGNYHETPRNLSNMGIVCFEQADYGKALDYHFEALKLSQKYEKDNVEFSALGNIAIVYAAMSAYDKAIEYNSLALEKAIELDDQVSQSQLLGNMGLTYQKKGDNEKALKYFKDAVEKAREFGVRRTEATNLGSIARVYRDTGQFDTALVYYFQALQITEEIGNLRGQATHLGGIGETYLGMKKYVLAETYLKRAEKLNRQQKIDSQLKDNCWDLYELYKQTGRPAIALGYYEEYISLRDSSESEENQKMLYQREIQFEHEKDSAASALEKIKNDEIQKAQLAERDAKLDANKKEQIALFGGLFLLLVFAGFMYNRFKVTQKQKGIIEIKERETQTQKHIIEEKHKEITDSINYAERIQRSFLASGEMLQKNLGDYFVFFKPKDVVSGDFYWAAELANGNFVYATADSTGHGVPGAIMSILNISSLEKVIEKETEPAAILNATRKLIIERLKKDGSAEGGKDGMDCSVCVIDRSRKKLFVAAAHNPVWLVRPSSASGLEREFIEIKADKMPVGKHDKQQVDFGQQEIDLQSGDVIYTLTDGFPDQFGGEKGKKFMTKNLRQLLLDNSHLPMGQQQKVLEDTLHNWVGALDQVDDITVVGVRVG